MEDLKSPLRLTTMDVGGTEPLIVVTNSSLVRVDSLYIIACVDAIVPAPDPDGVIVKQTVVGGRKSEGIICDAPMLGWGSSNSGVPVYLNEGEYTPGDTPPSSKPRPGGMMGGFEEALPVVEQIHFVNFLCMPLYPVLLEFLNCWLCTVYFLQFFVPLQNLDLSWLIFPTALLSLVLQICLPNLQLFYSECIFQT